MDRREGVPVDAGVPQVAEPAHHVVEGSLPSLVDAVGVVQRPRTVDRDPDEDVVLLEERRPLLVEEGAVGLDRVDGALAGPEVTVRQLDRTTEEVDAHEGRLAALPGDRHLRNARMRLDQLADVRLEQLVGHTEARARIEHLLREEEAIRAIEVADRAGRLREQVECRRCPHVDQIVQGVDRHQQAASPVGGHRTSSEPDDFIPSGRCPWRRGAIGSCRPWLSRRTSAPMSGSSAPSR